VPQRHYADMPMPGDRSVAPPPMQLNYIDGPPQTFIPPPVQQQQVTNENDYGSIPTIGDEPKTDPYSEMPSVRRY